MSRASKLTLILTSSLTLSIVWGVHSLQKSERKAMYQGVLRDEERIRERMKREELKFKRELELKEQLKRQIYLESFQSTSSSSSTSKKTSSENSTSSLKDQQQQKIEPVKLEGCKSC